MVNYLMVSVLNSDLNSVNTSLDGKAPTSHASSATTYGTGSASNYGHCKTINGLTSSSYTAGEALSAYQGYLLNQKIQTGSYTFTSGQISAGTYTDVRITFPYAFSSTPAVMMMFSGVANTGYGNVSLVLATTPTTSDFTMRVIVNGTSFTPSAPTVYWIAVAY